MDIILPIFLSAALGYIADSQRKLSDKIEDISDRLLVIEIKIGAEEQWRSVQEQTE